MILPWLIYGAIVALASFSTTGGPPPDWQFFLLLWFWLGVMTDLGFGISAWWRVRNRFRELALQRFNREGERKQTLST